MILLIYPTWISCSHICWDFYHNEVENIWSHVYQMWAKESVQRGAARIFRSTCYWCLRVKSQVHSGSASTWGGIPSVQVAHAELLYYCCATRLVWNCARIHEYSLKCTSHSYFFGRFMYSIWSLKLMDDIYGRCVFPQEVSDSALAAE